MPQTSGHRECTAISREQLQEAELADGRKLGRLRWRPSAVGNRGLVHGPSHRLLHGTKKEKPLDGDSGGKI